MWLPVEIDQESLASPDISRSLRFYHAKVPDMWARPHVYYKLSPSPLRKSHIFQYYWVVENLGIPKYNRDEYIKRT
jgi:hypothetical protein